MTGIIAANAKSYNLIEGVKIVNMSYVKVANILYEGFPKYEYCDTDKAP